jgi:hypothetical protein
MSADNKFLVLDDSSVKRVFIQSANINVFPCSRRGQSYDPEARLNTERTNRLRMATKGLKDSFIINFSEDDGLLKFVLGGYYFEVNLTPDDISTIASKLNKTAEPNEIYAHLSLHTNITLGGDYTTEILYRQLSDSVETNFLDVFDSTSKTDFFMGVSFTADSVADNTLPHYDLLIFEKKHDGSWSRHEDATVEFNSVKITNLETETINNRRVPAITLVPDGSAFKLKITLNTALNTAGQEN